MKRAPTSTSRCMLLSFSGLFKLIIQELGALKAGAASPRLPACWMISMQNNAAQQADLEQQ